MINQPEPNSTPLNSQLFTLRFWSEDLGDGHVDWRGKVQHINSGEVRYFRDWLMLETFVEELLQKEKIQGP